MASESSVVRHVFLTGKPGVGKTTAVRRVVKLLADGGVATRGFYTEERRAREDGRGPRVGFDIVSLDGQRWPLARLTPDEGPRRHDRTVGRYTVDVDSFERHAVPLLAWKSESSSSCVAVVDEVGKMESFSAQFLRNVDSLLASPHVRLLGTMPANTPRSGGGLARLLDGIRRRPDCEVITVTEANRGDVPERVFSLLAPR